VEDDDDDVEDGSAVVDLEIPELAEPRTDGDEYRVASDEADGLAVNVLWIEADPINVATGDSELETELLTVLVSEDEFEALALNDASAENVGGSDASEVIEVKRVERAEVVATKDADTGWLGASLGEKVADAEVTAVDAGD